MSSGSSHGSVDCSLGALCLSSVPLAQASRPLNWEDLKSKKIIAAHDRLDNIWYLCVGPMTEAIEWFKWLASDEDRVDLFSNIENTSEDNAVWYVQATDGSRVYRWNTADEVRFNTIYLTTRVRADMTTGKYYDLLSNEPAPMDFVNSFVDTHSPLNATRTFEF